MLTPDTKDPDTLCLDFSDRQLSYPSKLSTDRGVTWKDTFACNTLARVGRGGPLVSLLPGEFLLRRSIDGGTTWRVTPTDLLPYGQIVLAADPAAPTASTHGTAPTPRRASTRPTAASTGRG